MHTSSPGHDLFLGTWSCWDLLCAPRDVSEHPPHPICTDVLQVLGLDLPTWRQTSWRTGGPISHLSLNVQSTACSTLCMENPTLLRVGKSPRAVLLTTAQDYILSLHIGNHHAPWWHWPGRWALPRNAPQCFGKKH